MASGHETEQHVKGGPANHGAGTGLDAPTPPGGPLREDRPDADVNPTGPIDPAPSGPDPEVHPSSTPAGPSTVPSPSTPEGEPGPDPAPSPETSPETGPGTGAGAAGGDAIQAENAQTSLDQPSDASGAE